ncbi:SUMO protease ULP2 KNAG_0H02800 [Huiozyma naganishii CBS 8797]|uniref:Ubiquitin-like protease family profile domain-containing protein n=1 Tax=Huiozyma naganishii (strain ATCC MYA-139 / BCRC 22969 / CBS 8797 / KCTC 17520 / NBRC 10181 / NCYC 3082 / Yp74L-3) TaxID=1071383 RepID=J7R9Z1_HUIN7|nr:hypothetical protein KNAG_0H02800 [Kazachstania naganishii CBS 8797]CCK71695.1 hypothetical protein KNAG_0H02800 [Kazachstania naganishii CBS 8797]
MSNSKRRRIGGGATPIDTLSSPMSSPVAKTGTNYTNAYYPPHHTGSNRGSDGIRRDAKIVDRINNEELDLIPTKVPNATTLPLRRDLVDPAPSSDLEPIDGTPPMKRIYNSNRKKNNGLLQLSSPSSMTSINPIVPRSSFRNNNVIIKNSVKYLMSGALNVLNLNNSIVSYEKILCRFIGDRTGCRLDFSNTGISLFNPLDLEQDCKTVLFDAKFSCFAIVLKDIHLFKSGLTLRSSAGTTQDRFIALMWFNQGGLAEKRLKDMYDILHHSFRKDKVKRLSDFEVVMRQMKESYSNWKDSTARTSTLSIWKENRIGTRSDFLDKDLKSLSTIRRHTGITKSGKKIPLPNNDTKMNEVGTISASNFYRDHSTKPRPLNPSEDNSTASGPLLRRSARNERASKSDDKYVSINSSENNFETPEEFKPSLNYEFDDNRKYTITNQDFKCLYNNDWVNDSIIDFFIKYYMEESIVRGVVIRNEVLALSSFFYTKLISDSNSYYENVKKWVQNEDLATKKYIVIPININFHWFGCIISNLDTFFKVMNEKNERSSRSDEPSRKCDTEAELGVKKAINPVNGQATEALVSSDPPSTSDATDTPSHKDTDDLSIGTPIITVLTFDSLRASHSREVDPIREFLIGYAKDKYGMIIDRAWIKMKNCLVPQQPNMSDCGVHVIMTVKRFFKNPEETIRVWKGAKQRNRSSNKRVNEYFEKSKRDKARKKLRFVLKALQQIQIDKNGGKVDDPYNSAADVEYDSEDFEIIENMPNPQEERQQPVRGDTEHELNVGDASPTENSSKLRHCQNDISSDYRSSSPPSSPDSNRNTNSAREPISMNERVLPPELPPPYLGYREVKSSPEQNNQMDLSERSYIESSPLKHKQTKGDFSTNHEGGTNTVSPFFHSRLVKPTPHLPIVSPNLKSNFPNVSRATNGPSSDAFDGSTDLVSHDVSRNIVISDGEDDDGDVNLVGETTSTRGESVPIDIDHSLPIATDRVAEIQKDMDRELNTSLSSETFDTHQKDLTDTNTFDEPERNESLNIPQTQSSLPISLSDDE